MQCNWFLSKNLAIWKILDTTHSKDPSFQGIILVSTKGYFSDCLKQLWGHSLTLYIFLLSEKRKTAGGQMVPSLELRHLHPGNISVSIPKVEEKGGLRVEAIFST